MQNKAEFLYNKYLIVIQTNNVTYYMDEF